MLTKHFKLIAYVRGAGSEKNEIEQLDAIKEYCLPRNYKIAATFRDDAEPAMGLHGALEALSLADGLIVFDCSRLVSHHSDSFRDLRPIIAHKFMHGNKKIITVADGIENVTPIGQESLLSLLNDWSRREELHAESIDLTTAII